MQRCSSGDPRITPLLHLTSPWPSQHRALRYRVRKWSFALLLIQLINVERILEIEKSVNRISTTEIIEIRCWNHWVKDFWDRIWRNLVIQMIKLNIVAWTGIICILMWCAKKNKTSPVWYFSQFKKNDNLMKKKIRWIQVGDLLQNSWLRLLKKYW